MDLETLLGQGLMNYQLKKGPYTKNPNTQTNKLYSKPGKDSKQVQMIKSSFGFVRAPSTTRQNKGNKAPKLQQHIQKDQCENPTAKHKQTTGLKSNAQMDIRKYGFPRSRDLHAPKQSDPAMRRLPMILLWFDDAMRCNAMVDHSAGVPIRWKPMGRLQRDDVMRYDRFVGNRIRRLTR